MILKIKDLSKFYVRPGAEEKITIFDGLNLEVKQSETLSIMGRSGSGKSTLLSMIAGLDLDYQGQIKFNNFDIKSASSDKLSNMRANDLTIVFQQYHLMEHLTALENIILPLEISGINNAAEKALALLSKIGLAERKNHFPNQLSGGEKQRVAIARSVISKRKLILADEPTGNLDDNNAKMVSELFFELVDLYSTALIIVTHSLDIAKMSNRILVINGRQLKPY